MRNTLGVCCENGPRPCENSRRLQFFSRFSLQDSGRYCPPFRAALLKHHSLTGARYRLKSSMKSVRSVPPSALRTTINRPWGLAQIFSRNGGLPLIRAIEAEWGPWNGSIRIGPPAHFV